MKVSVIIPTFNHSIYITKCIESVLNQTYKNIECIIINDGSTDNTEEILISLKKIYPSLIIKSKDNGGLSSARNAGILTSTGELICFLDSDDYWLPCKVQNQVESILKGFDCVFSGYKFVDENYIETESNEFVSNTLTYFDFIERNPIIGSASSIMIRKTCINKIGFFKINLRSLEDLDYWFRLFQANCIFNSLTSKDVRIMKRKIGNMSQDYLTMCLSHLQVLYYQLEVIKKMNLSSKQLKKSLLIRLNKISWYAEMHGEDSLIRIVNELKKFYCGTLFLFLNSPLVNKFFKK